MANILEWIFPFLFLFIIIDYFDIYLKKRTIKGIQFFLVVITYFFADEIPINLVNDIAPLYNILKLLILCFLLYEETIYKKLLACLFFIFINIWAEAIIGILFRNILADLNYYMLFGSMLSKFIIFLIVRILKIIVSAKYRKRILLRSWYYVVGVLLGSIYLIEKIYFGSINEAAINPIIALLIIIYIDFLLIKMSDILCDKIEIKEQNRNYEFQIELYQNHIKTLKNNEEELRNLRHDFKKHMICIHLYAQRDEKHKLYNYLNKLDASFSQCGKALYANSGNIIIDELINRKLSSLENTNTEISVNLVIPPQLPLEDMDACMVLGNALDNVLEAISKVNDNKYISIQIIYTKNNLIMIIKNSHNGKIIKDNKDNYFTTKLNTKNHGLGLGIISKTIAKYDGIMEIKDFNKLFELKILMYL